MLRLVHILSASILPAICDALYPLISKNVWYIRYNNCIASLCPSLTTGCIGDKSRFVIITLLGENADKHSLVTPYFTCKYPTLRAFFVYLHVKFILFSTHK